MEERIELSECTNLLQIQTEMCHIERDPHADNDFLLRSAGTFSADFVHERFRAESSVQNVMHLLSQYPRSLPYLGFSSLHSTGPTNICTSQESEQFDRV